MLHTPVLKQYNVGKVYGSKDFLIKIVKVL